MDKFETAKEAFDRYMSVMVMRNESTDAEERQRLQSWMDNNITSVLDAMRDARLSIT